VTPRLGKLGYDDGFTTKWLTDVSMLERLVGRLKRGMILTGSG
jgi:hypothetical protein